MTRKPESEKNGGLRKGPWTQEEDQKLIDYIHKNGYGNWRTLPKNAGLLRCGKSCRLRWTNYLRPDIKRGKFSLDEEETIIQLHSILGNKWSTIASRLPGRTDNEIKNYWNTHIRKRLIQMGIDPVTHKPRLDLSSILSMTGIQPMVDLEHLRLAAWLLSFQGDKNLEYSYPSTQENNFESTLQVEDNSHHVLEHTFTQQIPSPFGVPFSNENYVILDDCHHVDHQSNFDNKLRLMSDFLSASTYSPSSSTTPINENSSSVFVSESNIE